MQSRATRRFWRLFARLPEDVQRDAKRAPFAASKRIPLIPGLQFKKLEGEDATYSARIGLEHRALAVRKGDRVVWYWIGSHDEYDRLI